MYEPFRCEQPRCHRRRVFQNEGEQRDGKTEQEGVAGQLPQLQEDVIEEHRHSLA